MIANIDPIQPGDAASPNLWNSRFAVLTTVLNGNVDSDNLKNSGVTREKIAPGAVASDKLDLANTTDSRGWESFSFGNFRVYTKQVVNNESPYKLAQGDYRYDRSITELPVGVVQSQVYWMGCTYTSGIQFLPKPYFKDTNTLATMIWNVGPDETINFTAFYMVWVRF